MRSGLVRSGDEVMAVATRVPLFRRWLHVASTQDLIFEKPASFRASGIRVFQVGPVGFVAHLGTGCSSVDCVLRSGLCNFVA